MPLADRISGDRQQRNRMASVSVTTERSLAIDRLKGLLILLIVIGHNSLMMTAFPDFQRLIYLFHVQSFFLLSACLSKQLPD
jgi:fucose 4-O-acetylase-like acetyltransferase